MLFKAFLGGLTTLLIIGIAAEYKFPPRPVMLYNPSASQPIGWYRVDKSAVPKVGRRVAAYAPNWARQMANERDYLPKGYPLIKLVLAGKGDKVCFDIGYVSVPNGIVIPVLEQDRLGREMPAPEVGCRVLGEEEYFIASPDVQDGFDSRYFGAVGAENIIGVVIFMGEEPSSKQSESSGYRGK